MCNQSVITYLQEKILLWLDEVWNEYCSFGRTEFLLGKIYAYVECLEIIMELDGADNDEMLALESLYGIR